MSTASLESACGLKRLDASDDRQNSQKSPDLAYWVARRVFHQLNISHLISHVQFQR